MKIGFEVAYICRRVGISSVDIDDLMINLSQKKKMLLSLCETAFDLFTNKKAQQKKFNWPLFPFQMEKIFIGAWKDKRGISDVSWSI